MIPYHRSTFGRSRSVVYATQGMAVTSQPLAAQAGIDILKQGGNAFDSAVAMAAVLCVVEPMMTGLGGDMFAIVRDGKTGAIDGLNASGRCAEAAAPEQFRKLGLERIPTEGPLSVSVPGVVDGWQQLLSKYGTMTFAQTLRQAIYYAEEGFAVTRMVHDCWKKAEPLLRKTGAAAYLPRRRAPSEGERFRQPDLARSLRLLAEHGRDAFYKGELADRIEQHMLERGGLLRKSDLAAHKSDWVTPISTVYRGFEVLEIPPNGQGLVVLEMLNMLEMFDIRALGHNSADYIQLFAEVKKRAYKDRDAYIADSDFADEPTERLLSKAYAATLVRDIRDSGGPLAYNGYELGGDTVYLTVADREGNIASVTNSVFSLFGSGELVEGTGIFLHNRGSLFTLDDGHPNVVSPCKRPFHTIIPSMVLKDGEPIYSFGVMGADMQPQGQVQVLVNLIDFGMNIQEAGEAPRFRHYNEGMYLESGIAPEVCAELKRRGVRLLASEDGDVFGVGGFQGIAIYRDAGVYAGGSDPRKDGCAIGY